jgi:glycosyltransferase involved in cell wall biosynthesis
MNILMLARFYYPHIGGVERHVENVCRELKRKNHDISVVALKHDNTLKNKDDHGGVRIIRLSYLNVRFFGLVSIWFEMLKNIRLFMDADVIHAHDVFIWYLPLRILLSRKRIYITFHGYESYPIKKRANIIRKISEVLASGNICIGRFIEKWYGTKADVMSYGAVDIKKYKKREVKNYSYDAVFASRLDEHTGISTYIDAVKILKKRNINLKLLVLGEGKYKTYAQKSAKVLGWVANPEVYYKKAKFAFASRYLAILEAFASKQLVFAVYDNPVKKDYLYMTPYKKWLVISSNSSDLAKNIMYYLKDKKERKLMIDGAYEWVQHQTWEKMTDNYLRLWGVK